MTSVSGATSRRPRSRPAAQRQGRFAGWLTEGSGFVILMLSPALLVLALVIGLPILKSILLSFDTVTLRRPSAAGTYGLHNYQRLVYDPYTWKAVLTSTFYMIGTVLGSITLALSAALLTRRMIRFRALARLTFLMPWTMPAVVTALVWGVMYEGNFGIINRLFDWLPFVSGQDWLLDDRTVLPALILAQVWNEFALAYVFFLAGLQSISEELYDAARIDRASAWQQFRFITLPQLRYIMAVIVILLLIVGFKSFPIIFILTGGGPARATETLTILTYNTAFRELNFSYSATLGILGLVVSLILVLIYMRTLSRSGGGAAS